MKKKRDIQVVIFDKDGTLFDCSEEHVKAFREFIAKQAFGDRITAKESETFFRKTTGLQTSIQIYTLCKKFGIQLAKTEKDARQKAAEIGYDFHKYLLQLKAPLFTDVLPTIKALKKEGKFIFVSSNNSALSVKRDLERVNITHIIDFYAGASPEKPGYAKGEPHFRAGAKAIGRSYEWLQKHAVMVGDAEEDMRRGKQGELLCIGRKGVFSEEKLRDAGADFVVKDFSQLPQLLNSI